jgi:putative transport protein
MIQTGSIPHSLIIVFLTAALGLALGSVKIYKFRLGLAGVLFMGIFFSHFGIEINHEILEFLREFGLILFVYTIGYQVGPGFFSSFEKDGLKLNFLAFGVVSLGTLVTIGIVKLTKIPVTVALGLFSGATTNTPSLGACHHLLKEMHGITPQALEQLDLGYALAYPFGIIGIILTLLLIKVVMGFNLKDEQQQYYKNNNLDDGDIEGLNIEIQNPNIDGITINQIPAISGNGQENGVVISRVMHGKEIKVATSETQIFVGDVVLVIGKKSKLEKIRMVLGNISTIDLRSLAKNILTKRIVITQSKVIGRTPKDLDFFHRFGVTLTRVSRAEIQLTPTANFKFNFGDRVTAVGEESDLQKVADELGNSIKRMDQTEIIPFFMGIVLGLLLGSVPFSIPGITIPIKLGMAGGPLIVAILLSRLGHFGKMIWYMPNSANLTLREFGIMMFLACVGLKSGHNFMATLLSSDGVKWIIAGSIITLVPILIVGFIAAKNMKLNYLSVCGLLAGSMTDPPALAYATEIAETDAPAVTYASVYPLTMVLRVIAAQILVMVLI